MLDKSIPYYNLIMKRKKGTPLKEVQCPKGYSFTYYKEGDEYPWAEIEVAVGEFDEMRDAISYFNSRYLYDIDELKKRMLFIEDENHQKVGTYTIWWEDSGEPSVNWVGLKPSVQDKGLGKALIYKGIEESVNLLGDVDIYLHTQTWSYKAIGIYLKAGFKFLKHETLSRYKNEYFQAKPYLDEKMKRKDKK